MIAEYLSNENKEWIQKVYTLLCEKMEKECERVRDTFPDVPKNGRYQVDLGKKDIASWVNGFWGGMLWQMYHATKHKEYRLTAEKLEGRLDSAFDEYRGLHHDVGFMWLPTAVVDYKLTGNERSKVRGLHAANLLAGRYNPAAKFIRAWNPHKRNGRMEDCIGWMIVDCLMNIPILYWAAKEDNNPAYMYIAKSHADTALKYILREDGSCNHIVVIDPQSGELVRVQEGQGFSTESAWSRGQAWAIYGFALSAKYTKDTRYLSAAKKVANYFIACTDKTNHVPVCDFRAPKQPFLTDTSAGACAVCGMLEIAEQLESYEREFYIESAINILKAIEKDYGNWNMEQDGLLDGARGSYHCNEPQEGSSFIFGEYYYVEAILRVAEKHISIW